MMNNEFQEAGNDTAKKIVLLLIVAVLLAFTTSYGNSTERTAVKHHQVVISGFEFVPKELKVSTGDTVTWVNKDVVPHNIIVSSNQKAVSPDLASGEKYSYVVKASFAYECGFHPSMKGKLVIP